MLEDIWIHWKHKNPALIKESRLELFCRMNGELKRIWTKIFIWDNCPVNAKTQFKGDLKLFNEVTDKLNNTGLRSVKLGLFSYDQQFPDDYVTAEFSPYQLKLSVVPKSDTIKNTPQSVWMYFDIRVKLELFWGEDKMIPTARNDAGMLPPRKLTILPEEKAILRTLRTQDQGANFKIGTNNREIIIDANNFKEGHDDEYHNDFVETTKLWGDGPRLPVIAEVKVKRSDGRIELCPPAIGNAKFLWDWEDTDDTQTNPKWRNWVDGAATQETRDFLTNIFQSTRDLTDPLDTDNCPTSYGGKRAKNLHPFPILPGYAPANVIRDGEFPFPIEACRVRKWAVFSKAWRTGALAGKTGVLFQPSRIAGDKYKLSVYLYYDSELDGLAKGNTFRPVAGDAHATAGFWEVFRRVNLTYIKRAGATAVPLAPIKQLYKKELGMIIEDAIDPLNEARYKSALVKTFKKYNEDSQRVYNNPILPLCIRYAFTDPNFQNNASPAVALKKRDDFQQAVEDAFKDYKVVGLEVSTANSFILEDVESNAVVNGTVVAKQGNVLLVLADRGGTFQKGDAVKGIASKTNGTVAAIYPSCWEKEIKEETHNKEREVKVFLEADPTISTTISWTPLLSNLSDSDKKKLKTFLMNVASQAATDESIKIKVKGKYNDKTNRTRRDKVKNYLEQLFTDRVVIEKKTLLAEIVLQKDIYQKYYPTNPQDRNDKTYGWLVTLLMQEGFKDYIDQTPTYLNKKGIYFFHFPGRDDLYKVKIAGASFPDSSKRDKGIVYITTLDAGYMTNRVEGDNSVIDYKNNNAVSAHEIAHALFIPHAKWKTGRELKPPPFLPGHHVPGDTCIMNYDMDSDHFCGFCMLRLRGWDWKTMKTDFSFGVPEIRLAATVGGNKSKVYSEDYPQKNTAPKDGQEDFHFAPEKETVNIEYKIRDPKSLITSGKIKLLKKSDRRVLWSRDLQPNEFLDGPQTIAWDGKTATTADFPDEYITIEHSPYIMEISVEGNGWGEPSKAWTHFEVQVESIKLEWGPKTVLAQSAAQGTTAAQLGVVTGLERDHQVWEYLNNNEVPAPYTYLGVTGEPNFTNQLPKPGETKKIFLVSNEFYTDVAEQMDNTGFDRYRASWTGPSGFGPNIPIFAQVLIKNSQNVGVAAPLALGNIKCAWDWKDVAETVDDTPPDPLAVDALMPAKKDQLAQAGWQRPFAQLSPYNQGTTETTAREMLTGEEMFVSAGGIGPHIARTYLAKAADYLPVTKPPGYGCHADRGGKRGTTGCKIFPAQADPGTDNPAARVFPFEVSHTVLTVRTWAAVSSFQKTGAYASKTGAIFQPAPTAGDASEISVYLFAPHELALVNVADTDGANTPDKKIPASKQAKTGTFEVWREVHIPAYYKKDLTQTTGAYKNFDWTLIIPHFKLACIRLRRPAAPQAFNQVAYNQAVAQVIAAALQPMPPPNALPSVIAEAIDTTRLTGEYVVGFKDHAAYKIALDNNAPVHPIPLNYYDNLLPGVVDPFTGGDVWDRDFYDTEATYKGATATILNWSRQAAIRILETYLGANPPDGIYLVQSDKLTNFPQSKANAFGVPFLPAHPNRACFFYFRIGSSAEPMENTIVHEVGHLLYLNHTNSVDPQGDPWRFHYDPAVNDNKPPRSCFMSYTFGSRFSFCGPCLLRLRGWSLYQVNPAGNTQENKAAVARLLDTGRTLFPQLDQNKRAVGDLAPPDVPKR